MNPFEWLCEWLVGYSIDWSATGTWAQLGAALIGVWVVRRVSRSELDAQRQVAIDERTEFAGMVIGICEVGATFIYETSKMLSDRDEIEALFHGVADEPTAASLTLALKGLDLNRMPNAQVAIGVTELRRLCGWTKANCRVAQEWFKSDRNVPPEFVEQMGDWRQRAQSQMNEVRLGFAKAADADQKLLKGGPRIRILKR